MKKLFLLALSMQAMSLFAFDYTPFEKPDVPDSLMHVSIYDEIKVKDSEIPVKMSKLNVDFVKEYNIGNDGKDISGKLQEAIDKYSAKGGANIHISKGDYQIGEVELKSNIHLLFEGGTILRPYADTPAGLTVFKVGAAKGTAPTVENVSIQGDGGRVDVLVPVEMNGFNTKFIFIRSSLVKDFYYTNFNIYTHKTTMPCLGFSAADKNSENYVGPTNGLIMNLTAIDAHYGYGLVQAQAGRNLRFYNLHGVGGITLRFETGSTAMNKAQFGGVWDMEGKNISVANGHGAVMCGPHGMKNGVCHFDGITAFSSGSAFSLGESDEDSGDIKSGGHAGSFGAGTSVNNVTAIFGYNAQIKTKELGLIADEYIDKIGKPGTRAIVDHAPSHTCVKIATQVPLVYDESTFHPIGFEYGDPIRITNKKDMNKERQQKIMAYLTEKYSLEKGYGAKGRVGRDKKAAATKGTKAEPKKAKSGSKKGAKANK